MAVERQNRATPTRGENAMDLGLQGKHAIVTGGVGASAKPSRGNWPRRGRCGDRGATKGIWRRRRGSWAPKRTGASCRWQPMSPARSRWTAWSPRRRSNWAAAHPGQQRVRARGLGHRDRPDRNGRRRGSVTGFQREVCRERCAVPALSFLS
jgi:hypothetical protein